MKDISVIIATYNPNYEILQYTLDSVINQIGIDYEIVITDDGSKNNYFDKIKEYFKSHNVNNYKLLAHKNNQGTVKNILDAVTNSDAKFIKTLGQGDALYSQNTLNQWLSHIKKSGKKWSFSKAAYFRIKDSGIREYFRYYTRPMITRPYKIGNKNKCLWNYLILNDISFGAALLFDKEVFQNALRIMADKIIYAEDFAAKLIIYEGNIPDYYPHIGIKYEFGSGVSTGKDSFWACAINKDMTEMYRIIINHINNPSKIQKRIIKIYKKRLENGEYRIGRYFEKGKIPFIIKYHIFPSLTNLPYEEKEG